MIKTISKVGNSHGIIFDSALLQLSHLSPGDQVNVEVHPGGTITLTPLEAKMTPEDLSNIVEVTMDEYQATMKELAK